MKLPNAPAEDAGLVAWAQWSLWLSRLDPEDAEVAASKEKANEILREKPRLEARTPQEIKRGLVRLSPEEAAVNRVADLAAMLRIGTTKINKVGELIDRVEEIAFQVADLRERFKEQQRPEWCTMADILDDVMDVLDAVRPGGLHVGIRE